MHPAVVRHWAWFSDLCHARQSSGFGVSGIPYTEIQAWAILTSTALTPIDVDLIRAADRAYMDAMAERGADSNG